MHDSSTNLVSVSRQVNDSDLSSSVSDSSVDTFVVGADQASVKVNKRKALPIYKMRSAEMPIIKKEFLAA